MRPSDRLLSDLDEWEARAGKSRGPGDLRGLLSRSLRGAPEDLVGGIAERWSALERGPGGRKRARAWVDAACLLFLGDYDGDPPLEREDWVCLREIFSAEAETLDMETLSYVMERILENGGF